MKKREKKTRRKKKSLLGKLLAFIGIIAGVIIIASTSYFNVKSFEITGNSYYSDEEITVMGNCKTGENIFWGISLGEIEERLQKDAYMADVKVKRILPNTVSVELDERKQVAAVVYGQHYVVIDNDGIVLRNTEVDPKVTHIHGLTISKIEVGQAIEVEEKVKLRQTLEMLSIMESKDMYFVKIEMTDSGVNAYVLENLVCKGTPQNIMEAMKTQNLQKTVAELFKLKIERGTINISGGEYISFNPSLT